MVVWYVCIPPTFQAVLLLHTIDGILSLDLFRRNRDSIFVTRWLPRKQKKEERALSLSLGAVFILFCPEDTYRASYHTIA